MTTLRAIYYTLAIVRILASTGKWLLYAVIGLAAAFLTFALIVAYPWILAVGVIVGALFVAREWRKR